MNKSLYLLASMLFFAPERNYAQKIRTLYEHDILFGKVKQVFQIAYKPGYKFKPAIADTTWFDENGKTVEMHIKPQFGALYTAQFLYSQDSSGPKMYIRSSHEDQIMSAKLNNKGSITEYASYFKTGKFNYRSFYKYDNNDNLILYKLYDKKNRIELTRAFKYNQDDMQIEEDDCDSDGKFTYQLFYHYDSFDQYGNWTKRTSRKKLPSGDIIDYQTVERQIVYY